MCMLSVYVGKCACRWKLLSAGLWRRLELLSVLGSSKCSTNIDVLLYLTSSMIVTDKHRRAIVPYLKHDSHRILVGGMIILVHVK